MYTIEEHKKNKNVLECIKAERAKDDSLQMIRHYIKTGCVTQPAVDYITERRSLREQNGPLKIGNQIVIPQTLRSKKLERVHHQDLNKCRERYKGAIWWPKISHAVKDTSVILHKLQ